MRRPMALAAIAIILSVFLSTPAAAQSAEDASLPDAPVADGWFFSQTGGGDGRGFAVTNADGIPFWTEFQNAGGVPQLGYPVSRRWREGPFTLQAFQKAVFQWQPGRGLFRVNVYDKLSANGLDDALLARRNIPKPREFPEDEGQPFSVVVSNHLALLDENEDIKAAWNRNPNWLRDYGLPVAYAEFDGLNVLRAQRTVLQQWLFQTSFAAPGQVVIANSGDHFKAAGLIPYLATVPHAADDTDLMQPFLIELTPQSSSEISLVWRHDFDSPVRQEIYRNGDLIASPPADQTNYIDVNLLANRRYDYRVVLQPENGTAAIAEGSVATLARAPIVVFPLNVGQRSLTLGIVDESNSHETMYRVTLSDGADAFVSDWNTSRCRVFDDLEIGVAYTFEVVARNLDGIETSALHTRHDENPQDHESSPTPWQTQIHEGNDDPWVIDRLNDVSSLYGLTDRAREWMSSDVYVNAVRDEPGTAGYTHPGIVRIGTTVGSEPLMHEMMHAFWEQWDGLPKGCDELNLYTFRRDVAQFMFQFRQYDASGQGNPWESWRPFYNYLIGASVRYDEAHGESFWDVLSQRRYHEIWDELFHHIDTSIPALVAGHASLIPPPLRDYMTGFIAEDREATWCNEMNWYANLTPFDRYLWDGVYRYRDIFNHSPDYCTERSEHMTSIPEPLREQMRTADRQIFVDFLNSVGRLAFLDILDDDPCLDRCQELWGMGVGHWEFWPSYTVDNLRRSRYYLYEAVPELGVELSWVNLNAVRGVLRTLVDDLFCGDRAAPDVREFVGNVADITDGQRAAFLQMIEVSVRTGHNPCG